MKKFLYTIFNYPMVKIEKFVSSELSKIPEWQNIIDIWAGEQQFKKYCKHLKYTSQDIAEYDGKWNGKWLQTWTWDFTGIDIICDARNIPVEDNSFDNILCTEILEHATNPIEILKEMIRILKPGGKIILTAPFYSWTHFAPYHFHTGFNEYWYKHFANEFWAEIIYINKAWNYYDIIALEVLRGQKEIFKQWILGIVIWIIMIPNGIISYVLYKISAMFSNKTKDFATFNIQVVLTKR